MGPPFQISNLNEDSMTNAKVRQRLIDFSGKINKIEPAVQALDFNVETHHVEGGKKKFSIRAKMITPKGMFVAHKWDWNIMSAIEQAINALEREMKDKYGKKKAVAKKYDRIRKS